MAGITQLVDDRIRQLTKDRAELDELRKNLEKREAELNNRQYENAADILPLEDQKAALYKEISEAQAEVARLRQERQTAIESFGGEMDQLHHAKTAESSAQEKELKSEISHLLKTRTEMEEELDKMRQQIIDLEEKRERDQKRIIDEKEARLTRVRAEEEATLQEAALQHSVTMADLDRQKKALESEIEALEQTKSIEWNKAQAEISRYKTAQFAELDVQKEQLLAEAEKEKADVLNALKSEEKRHQTEMANQKREWEQEELILQAQKQHVLDDIKLLEYEYEKIKSENIVKLEKARVDELKSLETMRVEALAQLELEQSGLVDELKKKAAALRTKIQDSEAAAELQLTEYEGKKSELINGIDLLEKKFNQIQKSNQARLEAEKLEQMKETDNLRIQKLQEIEAMRQQKVSELEEAYLQKITETEAIRKEKSELFAKSIESAEGELSGLKESRRRIEQEINTLQTEAAKIREENRAASKKAILEQNMVTEKLKAEKMAELETLCEGRLRRIDEAEKALTERMQATEEAIAEKTKESEAKLAELKREYATIEAELTLKKNNELSEIKTQTIEAMESLSKMKLDRVQEIEDYIESYKAKRLAAMEKDLTDLIGNHTKSFDELLKANDEYSRRMADLQQQTLDLEAEKRNLESHRRRMGQELAEFQKAKDEQIEILMQEQEQDQNRGVSPHTPLLF